MKLIWAGGIFFVVMTLVSSGIAAVTFRLIPSGGVVLAPIPWVVIWGASAIGMAVVTLPVVALMLVGAWCHIRHSLIIGLVSVVVAVGAWGLIRYLSVATLPGRDPDTFREAIEAAFEGLLLGVYILPGYLLAFLLLRWTKVVAPLLDPA